MNLYQGIFNWHGEIHSLWTYAKDEGRAFNNFIPRLCNKLGGKERLPLLFHFLDENKDNWKIVRR